MSTEDCNVLLKFVIISDALPIVLQYYIYVFIMILVFNVGYFVPLIKRFYFRKSGFLEPKIILSKIDSTFIFENSIDE